jgi:hypothetical protein
MLALILGFFALLCALLFPTVSQTIVNCGVFDQIEHFGKDCRMIKAPELEGCEGGQAVEGLVYYACTSVKDRTQYFPGSALSSPNPSKAKGWIAVFDPKTETASKLKYHLLNNYRFESFGDNEFNSHGMSLWQDPNDKVLYVAAVNHKLSGSVIELFSHEIGSGSLKHFKTVRDKNINRPNGNP